MIECFFCTPVGDLPFITTMSFPLFMRMWLLVWALFPFIIIVLRYIVLTIVQNVFDDETGSEVKAT